jgi:pimeloyl-ACP methyl ester carboxylesterase
MAALGLPRPRRKEPVREGTLHGGLPYLAVGQGPPLVVFVGLTAEHANTTGLARRLHRIAAPTLLVAGDRDRLYTPELFRETAERIPGARLRLYPGKGHAGVMTHRPAIREIVPS